MPTNKTTIALLLDTETTGTSRNDQIIEYAHTLFRVDAMTGEIVEVLDQYSAFQEPTVPINPFAQQVHGISLDQLRGQALDVAHIESNLRYAQLVLAHNVGFDKRFVSAVVPNAAIMNWRCTMRSIDWLAQGVTSRKMEDIIRFYGISALTRHRAADDVRCTLEAIQKVCVKSGRPHLWALLS